MQPNPNIALSVENNSPVPELLKLQKEGEQNRRQQAIDQSNLKTASQQQTLNDQAISQNNSTIQGGKIKAIAMDTLAVRRLLTAAEVSPEMLGEVGTLMAQQINRMKEIGAPTEQAERLAMLAATDPAAAAKFMDEHTIPALQAKMPELFKSEILSDSDVTEAGQVIQRSPDGAISATTVEGFEGAPSESFSTEVRGGVPVQVSSESGREFPSPRVQQSPSTVVNVNGQENSANKRFGEGIGDRASSRVEGAQESHSQNADLDRMLIAIENGASTGFGEETILDIKGVGETLGFDFEGVPDQEVIRKIQNEMALRLRNPDSGLGLTGSTSNKDLEFLKNTVPGLARSEEGNKLIIDFMKRKNQLRIDLADEQARLIEANDGQIPSNLDSELLKFANDYTLFNSAERRVLEKMNDGQDIRRTHRRRATGTRPIGVRTCHRKLKRSKG